jgi:hypothetical protein
VVAMDLQITRSMNTVAELMLIAAPLDPLERR